LNGENVVYVSGSDAHGTPILVAAEQTGMTPKDFAFHYHQQYVELIRQWNIQFDNYTITHNPTHTTFCQAFYQQLDHNGFIIPLTSSQLYCSQCQRFLPDRFVQGTCPYCETPNVRGDECTNPDCGRLLTPTDLRAPYCVTCGTHPIAKETTHWYFDLPRLASQLHTFLRQQLHLKDSAKQFSLNFIQQGLKPRPITRDLSWGIPVDTIFEHAEGKVLYVWAEAVLGYLSATQEWAINQNTPDIWKQIWQHPDTKTIYCIGKDNILFHSIIFPALLLAHPESYVLPYAITVTDFFTFEGQPFSKSKGIGIDAHEALKVAPADYWRYFLLINRPETKDFDFNWDSFVETINHDLNDTLGNFIYRTLIFIHNQFNGQVPLCGQLDNDDQELLSSIQIIARKQAQYFDKLQIRDALAIVLSLAQRGNAYLSTHEPWKKLSEDAVSASTKYYVATQVVNALAILLAPFLPNSSQNIRAQLNLSLKINEQTLKQITQSPIPAKHPIQKPKILFTKLQKQTILRALKT
jgi:methionyl-tRNA synthetase